MVAGTTVGSASLGMKPNHVWKHAWILGFHHFENSDTNNVMRLTT